jgi:drug/metabolite transporter (DMT)-like permease
LRRHPEFAAYFALACVCLFWGTTYLGIRMALESFPPLVLVGTRYILSGAIMLAAALLRGAEIPKGRDLLNAGFSGILILSIGNGCLTFAEREIPSGLAGLIITISPFWMVGLEALLPGGARLHPPTLAGMAVGLAGAALLVSPDFSRHTIDRHLLKGFLILQLGMAAWCFGSIYQRRKAGPAHPVVVGGVQQLIAGLVFLPLIAVFREHPIEWHSRGVAALWYLVIFGSIVGYSAYAYALDRLPVAIVSIYPYVNAVVAVFLGWLFYREPFGVKQAVAMSIIFAGVALVKWQTGKAAEKASILARDLRADDAAGSAQQRSHEEQQA